MCQIHYGKVASGGFLLDNAELVSDLTRSPGFKDIVGGEMEAWGLYQAAKNALEDDHFVLHWIVVKGICDWGSGKTKGWQPLAAAAATHLVHQVFSEPGALPLLPESRQLPISQPRVEAMPTPQLLPEALAPEPFHPIEVRPDACVTAAIKMGGLMPMIWVTF